MVSTNGDVANGGVIDAELAWLGSVMAARFAAYGNPEARVEALFELPEPPPLEDASGPYAATLREWRLDPAERLVLVLALAPYLSPAMLDPFLLQNHATGRRFTEFGGLSGQSHSGFLPTAETAMFLLANDDRARRIALLPLFAAEHRLAQHGLLATDHRHIDEPPLSAALRMTRAGLHQLLHGMEYTPPPSADFPATVITTSLDWNDLVLDPETLQQIDLVGRWIAHSTTLMQDWGLSRRLKAGYRCMFHGSPGTGKTLTATLLGKRHNLPVYRVDISRVVSKWIGETEKNLAALFDEAENRNWILFFDEADALFGKRGESTSANDRAANQQIAYLLQRLETYSGLAILATNQNEQIDEAFARRFQSSIRFPVPDAAARARLWRESFVSDQFGVGPNVDFDVLAARYELAGGAIINVLRYACLMAVERHPPVIHGHDLLDGIRQEMQKGGQYLSR